MYIIMKICPFKIIMLNWYLRNVHSHIHNRGNYSLVNSAIMIHLKIQNHIHNWKLIRFLFAVLCLCRALLSYRFRQNRTSLTSKMKSKELRVFYLRHATHPCVSRLSLALSTAGALSFSFRRHCIHCESQVLT